MTEETNSTATAATEAFEVVKHVTLPLIKFGADPLFLRFDGKIHKAKETGKGRSAKNEDGTTKVMEPPMLAEVTDMVTKRKGQIIVNEVLKSELNDGYPNESYVGRIFRVAKLPIQGGKRYATFELTEVKAKGSATPAAPAAPAAPVKKK